MTAQVARVHDSSLGMLQRVGFSKLSQFDRDYDVYGVRV